MLTAALDPRAARPARTTEPSARLEVNGSFKASSNVSGERELYTENPNAGNHRGDSNTQNATGLVYRVAKNPNSGDPILQVRSQGEAVRFFVEHDGWTGSTWNSAWFGGTAKANHFANKVGIGTTDPQAALDVNGRILRNGQQFSSSGSKKHGETVTVPWGTRDDWVIFVSPRSMGHDEGEKEGDNALLKIQCWASAIANNTTSWKIHARYKFRHASDNGHWSDEYDSYDDASANYLLVPK